MTVETRSGGDGLRKQESRTSVLQVVDEKTTKLQQFWNSKSEAIANKTDKHGAGDTSWIENLQDCPVFYPTRQEFMEDPLCYIQKIAGEACKYGICKVVSPVLASVPAGVVLSKEKSGFKFCTRVQPMRISNWDKDDKVAFPVKGRHYTLTEYEKVANRFFARKFSTSAGLPPRFIESAFWKELVGGKTRTVEYATDVDGSAFSTARTDPLGQSKWNLKGISRLSDSVLRLLEESIPGVTEPMLYIGMLFSMFAWHIEDHYLYSINYQHCGAPKTWYGVPGDAALEFEKVVKERVYSRELLNDTGRGAELDFLLAKTTMFAPKLLMDHGVPVFKGVQYPGEFIITFPRAYHAGFSHGFNCGEAVNFAIADWFPFGAEACLRYEFLNRSPILPHDELLCKEATAMSRKDRIGRKGSQCKQHAYVLNAFVALMQAQQRAKSTLEQKSAKTITSNVVDVSCGLCKHKCYVSYTHCKCLPEPTCLNHAVFFSGCLCEGDRTIVLREDFEKLLSTAQKHEHDVGIQTRRKLSSDAFIIKQGNKAPSVAAIKRPLPTNARLSRRACHEQQDTGDICTGTISINLEGSGFPAMSNCRQTKEEDGSDREVLKVKRRRLASSQSKWLLAEKPAVCRSLVRSLDFGSYSPVRRPDGLDLQENLSTHKEESFESVPSTSGELVSAHHVMEDNINGSVAEVMNQWQREASTKGLVIKIKEVTCGQERVLALKCFSCLKHLVSGEEAMVLQVLLRKVGHGGLGHGHGHGHGQSVVLDMRASSDDMFDNNKKVESFDEGRESLCIMPTVRRMLLVMTTEHFGSPAVMHVESKKKLFCRSSCARDLTSTAGLIVLCGESVLKVLQALTPNHLFVRGEHAHGVGVLDCLHPDRSKHVPGDFTLIRVGNEHTREEVLSLEAPCMEPKLSSPLTDLVLDFPSHGIHVQEEDCGNFQGAEIQPAELTCRSVTHQIRCADMVNGTRQDRALDVQDSTDMSNRPLGSGLAAEDIVCDLGLIFNETSFSSSLKTWADSCLSATPAIKNEEMGCQLRRDTVLALKDFAGKEYAVQDCAGLADEDGICDMEESPNENLHEILLNSESELLACQHVQSTDRNTEMGTGIGHDTVFTKKEMAEMENGLRERTSLDEEDNVFDVEEVSDETRQGVLASSERRLDLYRTVSGNAMQQDIVLANEYRSCDMEGSDELLRSSKTLGTTISCPQAPSEAQLPVDMDLVSIIKTDIERPSIADPEEQINDRIKHNMEEVLDEQPRSPNTLGTAISYSQAPAEAQPWVDVDSTNITITDFERLNPTEPVIYHGIPKEPVNDNVKPKRKNPSPPVAKQGLVIYLNRKVEHHQEKSAKFTDNRNSIENDYDQVDIFEGQQTNCDTWSVEEGMASLCRVQEGGKSASPFEQLPSFPENRVQCHYTESDGVQQSLHTSEWLPSGFQDDILSYELQRDEAQASFPESAHMRFDRSAGGEPIAMMHQQQCRTSVCSPVGGEYLIWESESDVIKPHSNFSQTTGSINSQLMGTLGKHKAESLESLNPFLCGDYGLPAHNSKQQRVEPYFETHQKFQAARNFSKLSVKGPDSFKVKSSSPWREQPSGYRAQRNECFKSNPHAGQCNWGSGQGHHNVSSYPVECQREPNNYNCKYKRTTRQPVHGQHHPYSHDTEGSNKYPRVFHAQDRAPCARWKRRDSRNYNCGWRYSRSGNAFGDDGLQFPTLSNRKVAGCSASTSEGADYVEEYDPVKWEISPCSNRQLFSSFDLHTPSSAGRVFPGGL